MSLPPNVLDLETRHICGEPTLWDAYRILRKSWQDGSRDREIGLHLMFITWYAIIEPEHLTGIPVDAETIRELNHTLAAVHEAFQPEIRNDPEMLYAFGLAAHLFWFMFENPEEWEQISIDYRVRYRLLEPDGLDASIFHGRGVYGAYYSGQAETTDGY